jgi:signal transduction histidine kinase
MSPRARPRRPRGLRTRLLTAVTLAVAAGIALALLAFNVVLDRRLDADARDLARSRASATLASVQLLDGRLQVRETLDDGVSFDRPVWIFAGTRALERPQAAPAVRRAAAALAAGTSPRTTEVSGVGVRLLALPVTHAGHRVGTVVAGVALAPYEHTKRTVLLASLALGAVLLTAAVLAARWLLAAGLRPVARMTAQAADWSEHDPDRRFALGPPHDELTQLGATLDRLLERLADDLRREQQFSAELSHELRTPLARLRARAQLALAADAGLRTTRAALAGAIRDTDTVARTLDALLTAARSQTDRAGKVADVGAAARGVLDDCAPLAAERHVTLDLDRNGAPCRARVTHELAERALHPLVENACRHAAGAVRVHVENTGPDVRVEIRDDGPGVPADALERIFQPGERGAPTPEPGDATGAPAVGAAGLGLALARRLARTAGGEVTAEPGPGGRFVLRLPAA